MNQEEWMKQLREEGFTDLSVHEFGTSDIPSGEHTHDVHTVHIILKGELHITENGETQTFKEGERVDFQAGTTHTAKTGSDGCTMIVGTR